ncbi:type II toxin-antitoxin system VapC family toxin [Pseudanabaena sp. FACHB-1050]|uniref:Ribonuclease VapC n=1 Tax=Phormidium tenue FACHB-1050 TaxID=2692857 RepID=A0ABR8C9Y5_9CYAN|nr:type II toxin-antitoxin system VapC family toxin [Phormidium tenue FACHB-1050]
MEKRTLTIFIDTSFIIALINERDQYHTQALDLSDLYIEQPVAITDAVLLEIANSLARRYKNEAIEVIEQFLDSEDVEVIRLTPEIFDRAFELYKTRPDKEWGLVDCVSFIIMQDRHIQEVLTFDQHFAQAGFRIL